LSELLDWYDRVKRDLPWRATSDPYAIWVSEIMLQQTQVATVIPYFERWMARFPTVEALAAAKLDEVLSVWQGLGYYRRARMLHAAAIQISGALPTSAAGWRELPGVGAYTAGAISSIAFGEPVPLVDGNVKRVFARLTAFGEPDPALEKSAWEWASGELDPDRPGDHNQALMELGATVCTPVNPRCGECPWSARCAGKSDPMAFPLVRGKPEVIRVEDEVVVPFCGDAWALVLSEGWWQGFWRWPEARTARAGWAGGSAAVRNEIPLASRRYVVTRHRVTLSATLVELDVFDASLTWFTEAEMEALPLPAPYRKLYRDALQTLR
jgi:A/G-specific adenine glycosylase